MIFQQKNRQHYEDISRHKIEQRSRRNSLLISNRKTAFGVFDTVLLVIYGDVFASEMTDLYVAYLDSDYDITQVILLKQTGNCINGGLK